MPAEEPNTAKRLLFVLLAVVFCQVLLAEEGLSEPLVPEDAPSTESPAHAALEPLNLTSRPADYALELSALLRPRPAAF